MAQTPNTKTHFVGGLQSGLQTGNPSTDTRAAAVLQRNVTVSAASSANITVPGDARGFRFSVCLTTGSAGTGGEVKFGTTVDPTAFGSITNVSAAGIYSTLSTVSGANINNPFGTDRIMVVRGSANNTNMLGVANITFNRG